MDLGYFMKKPKLLTMPTYDKKLTYSEKTKKIKDEGNYIKMLKYKIYKQEMMERSSQPNNKKTMIFPIKHFW